MTNHQMLRLWIGVTLLAALFGGAAHGWLFGLGQLVGLGFACWFMASMLYPRNRRR